MSNTEEIKIEESLVRRLVAEQFPKWSSLPIKPVKAGGYDNRTFHLGDRMSVRLPSAAKYSHQVKKEQHWLPRLSPLLSLPTPTPLAIGKPAEGYPWHWSIYKWLEGEPATIKNILNMSQCASSLAKFLEKLQCIDATDGPLAGDHNFYRGGSLRVYDVETRQSIAKLDGKIDAAAATGVWNAALATTWERPNVWVHGDIAPTNLLVRNGNLSAVIDFGCLGVGDPACDLAIAWTMFKEKSRVAFREAIPLNTGTWARSRGWALWKALITIAALPPISNLQNSKKSMQVIKEVVSDYKQER